MGSNGKIEALFFEEILTKIDPDLSLRCKCYVIYRNLEKSDKTIQSLLLS